VLRVPLVSGLQLEAVHLLSGRPKLIPMKYPRIIKRLFVQNLVISALLLSAIPVSAQKVYVGVADQWNELIIHGDQWQYVQRNADGFYVNFIEMNWVLRGEHGMNQERLNKTASLFTHKNAYFESDYKLDGQDEAADDRDIDMLQKAGFTVPYTSLNTGWDTRRYQNLKTYHLLPRQTARHSLVQNGPWTINGDITGNISTGGLFPNAEYRGWFDQADGVSTDGPLGYWYYDPGVGFNKMQSGSYSMVKYAHAQGKPAVVMLCPYGAGISTYDAPSTFLSTGEDCVRRHEDNNAEPEVYDVFEYATTIGAVPEQTNGVPAKNSTTALAYYLIKHIKGDPNTLHLSAGPGKAKMISLKRTASPETIYHYTIKIVNTSPWLDYAAVLKATGGQANKAWTVRYKLKGQDISGSVLGQGFKFYQAIRINPATTTLVDLYITRTASRGPTDLRLSTQLLPHQGQPATDTILFATPDVTQPHN